MKIVVIGDPHGALSKAKQIPLSGTDLILVTGDIGKADLMQKMAFENHTRRKNGLPEIEYSAKKKKQTFLEAYESSLRIINYLRGVAPVYVIFGNVESSNEDTREQSREIGLELPFLYNRLTPMKRVRIINNRLANFNGIRIGGLEYFSDVSWVKEFKPKPYSERFKKAREETEKAKRILNGFGKGLDILLCHQPPWGVLDKVSFKGAPKDWIGKHAGSKAILNYIKKYPPRYVVCGHIHEGKGKKKVSKTEVINVGSSGDYFILNID